MYESRLHRFSTLMMFCYKTLLDRKSIASLSNYNTMAENSISDF